MNIYHIRQETRLPPPHIFERSRIVGGAGDRSFAKTTSDILAFRQCRTGNKKKSDNAIKLLSRDARSPSQVSTCQIEVGNRRHSGQANVLTGGVVETRTWRCPAEITLRNVVLERRSIFRTIPSLILCAVTPSTLC